MFTVKRLNQVLATLHLSPNAKKGIRREDLKNESKIDSDEEFDRMMDRLVDDGYAKYLDANSNEAISIENKGENFYLRGGYPKAYNLELQWKLTPIIISFVSLIWTSITSINSCNSSGILQKQSSKQEQTEKKLMKSDQMMDETDLRLSQLNSKIDSLCK